MKVIVGILAILSLTYLNMCNINIHSMTFVERIILNSHNYYYYIFSQFTFQAEIILGFQLMSTKIDFGLKQVSELVIVRYSDVNK